MVLGSIVLTCDLLSSLALETLLNIGPSAVQQTLAHLHSIIIVPESNIQTIQLLHPSFADFLIDPK